MGLFWSMRLTSEHPDGRAMFAKIGVRSTDRIAFEVESNDTVVATPPSKGNLSLRAPQRAISRSTTKQGVAVNAPSDDYSFRPPGMARTRLPW